MDMPFRLTSVRVLLALALVLVALLIPMCLPMLGRLRRLPRELVPNAEKEPDAVRVGMLGTTFIGRVAVVFAARKRRDVIVAAIASRTREKGYAYAEQNGIPIVLSGADAYDNLLLRPDIDAVYISLPTRLHFKWAQAALNAGKHVLVEKPAALNSEQASILCALAKRVDRVLMEGAHHRYHPAGLRMQALASSSEVGQLRSLDAQFHMMGAKDVLASKLGLAVESSDQRQHERIKCLDRWFYCVDMLMWASGARSAEVKSAVEGRFSMSAELALQIPHSSNGTMVVNATMSMSKDRLITPFVWRISAQGDVGSVQLDNAGFPFLWHSIDVRQTGTLDHGHGTSRREQVYGEGETTFEHQLAVFVAAVRRGTTSSQLLDSTLATSLVIDSVLSAAGSGPLTS